MKELVYVPESVDSPWRNSRQHVISDAVGKRLVVDKPQEIPPAQSTGRDQMCQPQLRKDAETEAE